MKKRRNRPVKWAGMWMVLLGMLFLLASCTANSGNLEKTKTVISLYYLVDLQHASQAQKEVVKPVLTDFSPADATPEDLLERLGKAPEEGLISPIPEGAKVNQCIWEGKRVTVDFSAPYGKLQDYDLTCSNCAIVLTLTQLFNVEEVVFTVDGAPLPNWEQTAMQEKMVILPEEAEETELVEVELYFWNAQKMELQAERRMLVPDRDMELAAKVLYALIDGPEQEELEPLLPKETTLLAILIENRCCTITLSDEFWNAVPESAKQQETVLYSIVYSLKSLEFVDSVQIQSGAGWTYYGDISLKEPLS
ncbi:MAG: GerMN domain-containing protein [Oscillospiraceae bacterium]|nr:GerMN domain-containing protein [Oscillospiraceae bacterium]